MKFLSPTVILAAGGSVLLLFAVSSFAFDVDIKPSPKIQALKSILFPTPTPVPTPLGRKSGRRGHPRFRLYRQHQVGDIGKKWLPVAPLISPNTKKITKTLNIKNCSNI